MIGKGPIRTTPPALPPTRSEATAMRMKPTKVSTIPIMSSFIAPEAIKSPTSGRKLGPSFSLHRTHIHVDRSMQ